MSKRKSILYNTFSHILGEVDPVSLVQIATFILSCYTWKSHTFMRCINICFLPMNHMHSSDIAIKYVLHNRNVLLKITHF